ncbi:hypothetical protein [Marinoscillum sp.]
MEYQETTEANAKTDNTDKFYKILAVTALVLFVGLLSSFYFLNLV